MEAKETQKDVSGSEEDAEYEIARSDEEFEDA